MPESLLAIPRLLTQDDADAVMFELQDLPCVNRAEIDLQALAGQEESAARGIAFGPELMRFAEAVASRDAQALA